MYTSTWYIHNDNVTTYISVHKPEYTHTHTYIMLQNTYLYIKPYTLSHSKFKTSQSCATCTTSYSQSVARNKRSKQRDLAMTYSDSDSFTLYSKQRDLAMTYSDSDSFTL